METIDLSHPAWFTTFPCLVTPHPEEAFVSLLLRCDEANGWASGTTYTHVRDGVSRHVYLPDLVVPSMLPVETLAGRLGLPTSTIAATTYLFSLMRLFEIATPLPGDLCSSFQFRLCPLCMNERHILRYHFLLGITTCLQHRLLLLSLCTCGATLRPFASRTSPFTCSVCTQDWRELPHVPATPEVRLKEQQILASYEWWLKYGDRASFLMNLDGSPFPKDRGSRWTSKKWSRLRRSSAVPPLSTMVSRLDQWDRFSHFSETRDGWS